jgi:hypothetical protein
LPRQVPLARHTSSVVHGFSSLHAAPTRMGFAGHMAEVPSHVAAFSHWFCGSRHTKSLGRNRSDGQSAEVPVQVSSTSHGPAASRHTVPAPKNVSGHSMEVPVQTASSSHSPRACRHGAPALAGTSSQSPVVGLQTRSAHELPLGGHVFTGPGSQVPAAVQVPLSMQRLPLSQGSPALISTTQKPWVPHTAAKHWSTGTSAH